jgi:nuclear receptor coactivator 2
VCIARRIGFAERTAAMLGIEQFTTKQDLNGKILDCDTNRSINPVPNYKYPDFINQNIQEFCHANDMQQLTKHHKEVLRNGSNTSGVYRFKLQENRFVFVQTKSKLFKNPNTSKPEFIMSTHSIVRECDAESELKGSASTSLMKSIIGQSGGKNRYASLCF